MRDPKFAIELTSSRPFELTSPPLAEEVAFEEASHRADRERTLRNAAEFLVRGWRRHTAEPT